MTTDIRCVHLDTPPSHSANRSMRLSHSRAAVAIFSRSLNSGLRRRFLMRRRAHSRQDLPDCFGCPRRHVVRLGFNGRWYFAFLNWQHSAHRPFLYLSVWPYLHGLPIWRSPVMAHARRADRICRRHSASPLEIAGTGVGRSLAWVYVSSVGPFPLSQVREIPAPICHAPRAKIQLLGRIGQKCFT